MRGKWFIVKDHCGMINSKIAFLILIDLNYKSLIYREYLSLKSRIFVFL